MSKSGNAGERSSHTAAFPHSSAWQPTKPLCYANGANAPSFSGPTAAGVGSELPGGQHVVLADTDPLATGLPARRPRTFGDRFVLWV